MSVFSDRIKLLRLEREEKQSDVAEVLGVSVQSYSAYEASREPNYELLCKLANYFNVTTDYLLGASDCRDVENHNIHEETGLSEEAIESLKYCIKRDKENSITLTVNTLLEDKHVLVAIAHYLYYKLDDNLIPNSQSSLVPFSAKYKYSKPDAAWTSGETPPPIDGDAELDCINNEKYTKLEMLEIQEFLIKLLEKENITEHFK
jgi:transcriptional regulator with XRE-family HTH domain